MTNDPLVDRAAQFATQFRKQLEAEELAARRLRGELQAEVRAVKSPSTLPAEAKPSVEERPWAEPTQVKRGDGRLEADEAGDDDPSGDDLADEKRALGMVPCADCEALFLPDHASAVRCSACSAPRALRSPPRRNAGATSTAPSGYDASKLIGHAHTLDSLSTLIVVMSTISGVIVGVPIEASVARALRIEDSVLLVCLVTASFGLLGYALGRWNVIFLRIIAEAARCLVEIERSQRRS